MPIVRAALAGFFLLLVSASAVPASDPADCSLAQVRLGDAFPGNLGSKEYRKSESDFFEPRRKGDRTFRLIRESKETKDYVVVREGKVVAVIRELQIERLPDVLGTLVERFGESARMEMPTTTSPVTRTTDVRDRWEVPRCRATVELIARQETGPLGISQSIAVIMQEEEVVGVLD